MPLPSRKLSGLIALMRLHRPIGIWLVFFPAAWGVLLAQPDGAAFPWVLLVRMLVGAVILRGAGCILNDLADRRFDAQVERTRTRPLVTGAVTVPEAVGLLVLLGILGLALIVDLPARVFLLALLAVPMIAAYPWMKRITWWPQAFLGVTFNLGVPIGWAATGQPMGAACLALYGGCILWTLGYDTIYALQDMQDDVRVGVKSTARHFGPHLRGYVGGFYAATLLLWGAALLLAGAGLPAYAALLGVAVHFAWQRHQLRPPFAPTLGGRLFVSNQWVGLLLFGGLLLG